MLNHYTVIPVLSALLFVGLSVLIGWILTKAMKSRGFVTNQAVILSVMTAFSVLLFLRFGWSVAAWQGLFLAAVLIYASCSDLTDHTVDDHVWVTVLALSLCSVATVGGMSMLIGGLCVFVPQIALSLLPPHKTLGGADIKLSTALAFLLGAWRGIAAYLLALVIAVVFISIRNRIKKQKNKKAFALVPFLAVGALLLFLV